MLEFIKYLIQTWTTQNNSWLHGWREWRIAIFKKADNCSADIMNIFFLFLVSHVISLFVSFHIVQVLLQNYCPPFPRTLTGETPLDIASERNHTKCIKLLGNHFLTFFFPPFFLFFSLVLVIGFFAMTSIWLFTVFILTFKWQRIS